MNAGFSNLATLKSWLLPAGMVDGTDFDAQILAIGLGVASKFEGFCNRDFLRVVDDTFDCTADRWHVVLPRYPLEAAPTIALRESIDGGYVDQVYAQLVVDHNLKAGLIKFGAMAGPNSTRLRFTYTAGYWWNQQEPDYAPPASPTAEDPDLSVLPSGAIALPDDLQLAFRLQCEWVWSNRDKLGLSIGEKKSSGTLAEIKLLDDVKDSLNGYKRYSLT